MLILILLTILPLFVQAEEQRPTISDIDYIGLLGEKNNLEKKLEDYVNTVLDRMMGPEKASCVISITPEVEKSKIETETWAKQESNGVSARHPPQERPGRERVAGPEGSGAVGNEEEYREHHQSTHQFHQEYPGYSYYRQIYS